VSSMSQKKIFSLLQVCAGISAIGRRTFIWINTTVFVREIGVNVGQTHIGFFLD
jgi:hypothetical protein